jgi:hypothetical protein
MALSPPARALPDDPFVSAEVGDVIGFASLTARRGQVLDDLGRLVADRRAPANARDARRLHRLLAQEPWLFGEEYALMRGEVGLSDAQRVRIGLAAFAGAAAVPTPRATRHGGPVDLQVVATRREPTRAGHLVVETTVPSGPIGRAEYRQTELRAAAVLTDPSFAGDGDVVWDFVLVGSRVERAVGNRVRGYAEPEGLVLGPLRSGRHGGPTVRVFVRSWRAVLEENRSRLRYYRTVMDHDPSADETPTRRRLASRASQTGRRPLQV